jgi:hypothetical protein
MDLYLHSPNTPLWSDAQLKEESTGTYLISFDYVTLYYEEVNIKKTALIIFNYCRGAEMNYFAGRILPPCPGSLSDVALLWAHHYEQAW